MTLDPAANLGEFRDGALYDAEYGPALHRMAADLVRWLGTAPCRVLDLACGTGTVALALSAAGHAVTGVDLSPGMLAQAQRQPGAERVRWLQADICALRLPDEFDVVLLTGNAVQAMLSAAQMQALLHTIRLHLRPGGCLLFDTRLSTAAFPHSEPWDDWHTFHDPDGQQVAVSGAGEWQPGTQQMTWHTRRTWPDGRHRLTSITCRFLSFAALQAELEQASFALRQVYQDWSRQPSLPGQTSVVLEAVR